MNTRVVLLFLLALSTACSPFAESAYFSRAPWQEAAQPPEPLVLPCVWDVALYDAATRTRKLYALGPVELLLEMEGVRCVIPPIIRDVSLAESALLYCQYDDSKYVFSAEVQVDPRNDEPAERSKEFIVRRTAIEPVHLNLACR